MITGILNPARVVEQLVKQRVTHMVTLPDSETRHMYDRLIAEPTIHVIPVSREGEAIPVAAGLWIAGQRPVISIQNAGLFESGDALRGLAIGIDLPLVMFIGYRGYTRHGDTPDSAARILEPYLHLWGVDYFTVESDADLDRVPMAFERAERRSQPVAVLIGTEYAKE
ncbi:MAG: thiamine pyrophosphate-binding protein [Chloroflexi bacterium]|nr:thiamine pyrophosphate-binding protein [Chloroflexota bacterium]MDA1297807.1 thiamine pyrophosphate-binding protein [Chloroflexota bacterium]